MVLIESPFGSKKWMMMMIDDIEVCLPNILTSNNGNVVNKIAMTKMKKSDTS